MEPLFEHQEKAIQFHIDKNYSADFSEQGTGKTRTGIEVIRRRLKKGIIEKVLIACPSSVTYVWGKELEKYSNIEYTILVGQGREKLLQRKTPIFIISYDSIHDILHELSSQKWDMFIGDESSRIKNPEAKRTQAVIELTERIPYRMLMSATPIPRDIMDLWSQFMVLDRGASFYSNFYKFRALYFTPYKTMTFTKWTPKPMLFTKVKENLTNISIRFRKKDCLDLPPKLYETYSVELSRSQKEKYDALAQGLPLEEFNFQLPANILAEYAKLSQITSGFLYLPQNVIYLDLNKIKLVKDLVEDVVLNQAKVILYYVFTEEKKIWKEALKMYHPLVMDGSTSQKERGKLCERFQTDPEKQVFLIQEHCGIGITLTEASSIIYINNTFSYEDRYQSEDRAHRAGQRNPVTIIDIITKDTIDERVIEVIEKKKQFAGRILDD